ncbi:MAG: VCBS repeat-containing protein, partial [Bradymonadaceae bacterium]|nr:VCBS repeat-containing protein [Lujinxingiaceae bacterium]
MKPSSFRCIVVAIALSIAASITLSACNSCNDELQNTGPGKVGVDDAGDIGRDTPHVAQDTCTGASCTTPPDTTSHTDTSGDDVPGPTCPLELTCGSGCCESGQLCIRESCVVPGDTCQHTLQCPEGHSCEPTLGRCIPQAAEACIYRPDSDIFDPVVLVAWVDGEDTPEPTYKQVMMTPAVVDMTNNGTPDIVFSTFKGSNYNTDGILRAVDGRTFEPVFDLVDLERRVSPAAAIALGDIDGDGRNEIVAVQASGQGLIAFDDYTTEWAIKWTTDPFSMGSDGPALADLDGDGRVEVIAANRVYDGQTGELLCINTEVGGGLMQSIAIDLNGDGRLEVLAGNGAFRFESDGEGGFNCPTYWTHQFATGLLGVGDFGTFTDGQRDFDTLDGIPEVVTVNTAAADQIQLVNGQTGERIWSVTLPATDHPFFTDEQCTAKTGAGPPTVADFDGDGRADVAMAGACYYVVYRNDGSLLWKMPVQDFSSRVTGSSVFDFQGDGKAEVVYGDECFLRVYDGAGNGDGTTNILFEIANTTGTLRELPVIVDVDGDFHADIVVMSNDYSGGTTNRCRDTWSGFDEAGGPSHGIRVIKDRENRWVSTRPVWNQHAYHVTNVCDGIVDATCPGTVNR